MAANSGNGESVQQRADATAEADQGVYQSALTWQSAARLAVALGIMLLLIQSIQQVIQALVLLLAAISISQALSPLVSILERHMPRTLAVVLIYLGFLLVLGGLLAVAIPRLVDQVQEFIDAVPGYVDEFQSAIDQWGITTEDIWDYSASALESVGMALVDLPVAIASGALEIFLVLAISLYWLLAAPAMLRFTLSLFPEERREEAESVMVEMGQTMGGYIRGQALVSVVVGLVAYIGLTVLGVQYALVLAIIAAILEVLPNIGPILATIPMVVVAFFDSWQLALIVLVFWIIIQQLEAYVLTPNVLHRQADVPPLLVLLAIFTGGAVYGLVGAVVAIPVAGALRIFVIRVVAPIIRSTWGQSGGTAPAE